MKQMNMDFAKENGLVPAVIQDDSSGEVLMLGYMNKESLDKTQQTGRVYFWSRKRKALWQKGETSGNTFTVVSMAPDCDCDAILIRVRPAGPACHTGSRSCFIPIGQPTRMTLTGLCAVIRERQTELPEGSYTASLFRAGNDRIAQKVGEEATEVVIAAKNDNRKRFIEECTDLLYHLFVLMASKRVTIDDIEVVMTKRRKK